MIIYYGTRLYGKVDQVDDTGIHVATKFFHIWFVPLIPLGSTLVLSKTDGGWNGLPHPFSFKSLLVTWGRLACLPALLIGTGACVDDEILIGVAIIVASIAFFIGSYFMFAARGRRKEELLAMIGARLGHEAAEPAQAPAADPYAHGPLLIQPEVGHAAIAQVLGSLGLQQVQAPPGALAQFADANVSVTIQQGPLGIVALSFEGFAADRAKRQLASMLPHLGIDQIAWMLQSQDPAQAHAGVTAAMAMQLHGLRPSVERLSMHPDPTVRAEAQRALGVLQPAY